MLHTQQPYPSPALVRYGYSEFDTWGHAIPGTPFRSFATFGSLDAPEVMPAGSTKVWGTSNPRVSQSVTFRP